LYFLLTNTQPIGYFLWGKSVSGIKFCTNNTGFGHYFYFSSWMRDNPSFSEGFISKQHPFGKETLLLEILVLLSNPGGIVVKQLIVITMFSNNGTSYILGFQR
jgi:hypothetical protein